MRWNGKKAITIAKHKVVCKECRWTGKRQKLFMNKPCPNCKARAVVRQSKS